MKLSQKKDLREQLKSYRINQNHSQDWEKLINVVVESKELIKQILLTYQEKKYPILTSKLVNLKLQKY